MTTTNTAVFTRRFPAETSTVRRIGFGVADDSGREWGYRVTMYETEYVAQPSGERWGHFTPPGRYFEADCQLTRAGHSFGSSALRITAATARGLEDKVEKKIKAARARKVAQAKKRAGEG